MTRRRKYLMGYFYCVIIFSIVSAINILPQDNTNNMMQDKTDRSNNNEIGRKIEQNANYYTSNLKAKLNLTDSQMKYIYEIMLDYFGTGNQTTQRAALRESKQSSYIEKGSLMNDRTNTETSDDNDGSYMNTSSNANKKIENILDNEQMGKWSEIKDSWWVKVKTELYEGDQNIKQSKDIHERKGQYEDNREYENYDVYYPGYDFK